ncbi:MAG: branched-chain amino acid ABC transporter permease [Christensenellales bacterium]|jgi:branched-chain amino acid transport system permease protein
MLVQLFVSGISMGMIYALMAMGLILIVKAVGVLNFAHGDIFVLGSFIAYMFIEQMNLPFVIAFVLATAIYVLFGVIFMLAVYWPLRDAAWIVTVTISTIGASMALNESVRFLWGPFPLNMRPIVGGALTIGNISLEYQYLFIIGIASLLIYFVFMLFERSFIGKQMQATAQDRYAAEMMGIPTVITIAGTYGISIALSGVGGMLAGPLFLVSQSLNTFALKAFAGIVIGGFGSIKGAVVGSLLIGLIEAYSTLITTTYKDAMVFLVLILVLIVRPQGLFGEKIADKA